MSKLKVFALRALSIGVIVGALSAVAGCVGVYHPYGYYGRGYYNGYYSNPYYHRYYNRGYYGRYYYYR